MKPHRLVLLGPPASGKGTQGQLMAERWHVPVVSAGDVLRAEIAANTPLGQRAAHCMAGGALASDDIALAAMEAWLAAHGDEFVFDGFPRTVGQAAALDQILARRGSGLTAVLWLEVAEEEIAFRVSRRVVCTDCARSFQIGGHVADRQAACPVCGGRLITRTDDDPITLRRRMQMYAEHTHPLKIYYEARGLLRLIDAGQPAEEVFREISVAAAESPVEATVAV